MQTRDFLDFYEQFDVSIREIANNKSDKLRERDEIGREIGRRSSSVIEAGEREREGKRKRDRRN